MASGIDFFINYLKLELNRSDHTVEAYHTDLTQFAKWLTDGVPERFDARSVTTSDIRGWLATLSRQGDKPVTIRRKTQSLRAFYRFLHKRREVSANPAADIILAKTPSRLPAFVKESEMEKILTANEVDDSYDSRLEHIIISLLYATGMRRAELAGLTDADLNLRNGEVRIFGKRRKERIVPLPLQLCHEIAEWQKTRDAENPGMSEPRPLLAKNGKKIGAPDIYTIVKRALASTSAAKKSPHVLRHTFATGMLNNGADLNSVKEFLGHSSLATTQIYTHVSLAEMRKAYSLAHPRATGDDHSKKGHS